MLPWRTERLRFICFLSGCECKSALEIFGLKVNTSSTAQDGEAVRRAAGTRRKA